MDSNRIRNLATGVREALRAEVSARLDSVLAPGSPERLEKTSKVIALEKDVKRHGRDEVVDRAAYTWFNRLCALRFMDANGYTPTPVVTPRKGSTQPAILADAMQGVFDQFYEIPDSLRVTLSTQSAEEVYERLLTAVCSRYAKPMGYLFAEDVASSLLMPRGLISQGSILSRIVQALDEETCSSVEVLGWLYQFYISEHKDEVFASYKKGKKAQATDIAPVTQLFTPEWIVRYLVENSLGRLWMLNNPSSELAEHMEYYIAPENDEPHIEITSADEIRVLDPACGSGHILVYAFDLLYRMYEEEGWLPEDIPAMILRNNLAGLEIDRRAAEIASFALEMKALERDPRFLEREIDADIYVLEPVRLTSEELLRVRQLAECRELLDAMGHLDEVGSLYIPDGWDAFTLDSEIARIGEDRSLLSPLLPDKLRNMRANVEALSKVYHVVVANPPYMGSRNMNSWFADWESRYYPDEKSDLCTCFIERSLRFSKDGGYASLVTMHSWMFLGSFERMRQKLISSRGIVSMAHLGTRAFDAIGGEVVQTTATVFVNAHSAYEGQFLRLVGFDSPEKKRDAILEASQNPDCSWFFRVDSNDFKAIPSWPIAYWIGDSMRRAFISRSTLGERLVSEGQNITANNELYLRLFWEIPSNEIGKGKKYRFYAKGGEYRKWYGNLWHVVDWSDEARAFYRNSSSARIIPEYLWYQPGVTWTLLTTGSNSFRLLPSFATFDKTGSSVFFRREEELLPILGLLNSSLTSSFLSVLNPTLACQIRDIQAIPFSDKILEEQRILPLVEGNLKLSNTDWNSFETSWDFSAHPLVRTSRIANAYALWDSECRERFDTLKSNEEELNLIFARIYDMEDEVPIEVPGDKVSVRLADRARDAKSLISYGIGCMLGRYSIDEPGLVLADQGQVLNDFREKVPEASFVPDADNVLPVLDAEWFEDDVVTGFRSWLAAAYGPETVDENVAWLEESIGKDLRSFLCRDFYADHIKVYQKRPIYWMFQSPKGAFRCLVYMQRYNEGTVGTILTGYLRPFEDKLRARIQMLSVSGNARDVREADRLRAQLVEVEQWEREVVYPLAHERVAIDLDDGVKANYNRFPMALAKVTGLSEWK